MALESLLHEPERHLCKAITVVDDINDAGHARVSVQGCTQ